MTIDDSNAPLFRESHDGRGIARITLNRPQLHNAFNDRLITDLTAVLRGIHGDETVRALVLTAEGKSFSAGADLNWMREMATYTPQENLRDAEQLAELMHALDTLCKPTIALVQGPAYGGGVGLVSCCDIAIATSTASFALSEVRLGLIPAVISPYVVTAMGIRAARRYFLTGERFSAETALHHGLVHEVVAPEDLEAAGERMIEAVLAGGPKAQEQAKLLIADVGGEVCDERLRARTAGRIAELRASQEGREGVNAFLEKRKPRWRGEA